jgi:transposase
MMEALMMLLSAQMPINAMADLVDEHDTRLWRVLMHYVEQAHAKNDWSAVRRIAVDEISARRGHRYVTNVLDADNSRLPLMVEGRSSEALAAFAKALVDHGGYPAQIQAIAMDMSLLQGRDRTLSSCPDHLRQVPRHDVGWSSAR